MEMNNQDKISNLPGDLIGRILLLLPIKEAAKTSVLSSKWRYRWEMVPSLVFNHESLPIVVDRNGIAMIDKLVKDINRALMLHSGPIHKFVLSYKQNLPSDEIDKWIRYVSRYSPIEFVLEVSNSEGYKVHTSMFSWHNLTRLVLVDCLLRPPSTFNGFKHLKNLDLRNVSATQDVLECLVSSSPALQSLILWDLNGLNQLNIDAPNLQFVKLRGQFVDITLKCTKLEAVTMHFNYNDGMKNGQLSNHSNFVKLMTEMLQIGKLNILNHSIQCLVYGDIPRELPRPFSNLYYLNISIDFARFNNAKALLCLLRSVPYLQELKIISHVLSISETIADVWEADSWNRPFTRLRCVDIIHLSGLKAEMDFIKLMLLTTPVLESMVVKLSKRRFNKNLVEKMRRVCFFKRASPLAQVNILDP